MSSPAREKIVVLGMMTGIPVPGVVWQTLHYVLGFERLGFETYYVETHARAPGKLMKTEEEDGSARATAFIDDVFRRFGLGDRWAYVALHDDGRCYGLSQGQLDQLYGSASLLINLHGGTAPLPELEATDRLVYVETDPVGPQVELHAEMPETIEFLEAHCAFFTFAENYARSDCGLPVSQRFQLRPTRQPVVLDLWQGVNPRVRETFTTVANWKQTYRDVTFRGETYSWSKHHEFLKFVDLPGQTGQRFELALSNLNSADRRTLDSKGWQVRNALDLSTDTYRSYIAGSRAEFSVAKDQNLRLRTGWFSDRSATYLAAGRPVICQETGFSNIIPTGEGLFGFTSMAEAAEAVDRVNADYDRHSRAALDIAREFFSHEVVLRRLLEESGLEAPRKQRQLRQEKTEAFPPNMALTPISRRPTRLPEATVEAVMRRAVPALGRPETGEAEISIVVVTYDNLAFTRLCLESVLANTEHPRYELVVVDNGSGDGTPAYLRELAKHNPHVQLVLNRENRGFASAVNQGIARASGSALVLINNDTLVAPGWLSPLVSRLDDPGVGLVGPVTNRIGTEAEIETSYETWDQFCDFARRRAQQHQDRSVDVEMLAMFCVAMRRDTYERVGPLDQRFEIGMLEDDDYALRIRHAGLRLVLDEAVVVHHFGEASFGKLFASGERQRLLAVNRDRFKSKWGALPRPYERRPKPGYELVLKRVRELVQTSLPPQAAVLVVSRGDDKLLQLNGCRGQHFPQADGGVWAGHHPADSAEVIDQLERLRAEGGEFLLLPSTAFWWLDHYDGLRRHLEQRYRPVVRDRDACVIFALDGVEA